MLTSKARMSQFWGHALIFYPSPTPPNRYHQECGLIQKAAIKSGPTGGVSVVEVKRPHLAEDGRHRKVLPHTAPPIGKLDLNPNT